MITLKTTDKNEAKTYFEKEGIAFFEHSCCLCAKDCAEVLGYCLFDIEGDVMNVRAVEPQGDLMLLDGVLRSALHVAASRNVKKAVWSEKAPENIFKTLGLVTKENTLNINALYNSECACCKK